MTEVHRIRLFQYVPSPIVSISLRKNTLLVGRDTGYVEIWSVKHLAKCMCSFSVADPKDIRCVLWLKFRGEKCFAVCTLSGQIFVYEYPSLKLVATTSSFGGAIWGAAVNQEQNLLAVACNDGAVHVFDTKEDLQIHCTSNFFFSKCLCVCFTDDGHMYAGDSSGHISRICLESGRFLNTFTMPSSSSGNDLAIWCICGINGGAIASGDSTGKVTIWNPMTATIDQQFASHQADILCIASKDKFLYASGIDPTVIGFEYNEKKESWIQKTQKRLHTHDVTSIAIGERYVFTAGLDATIFAKKGLALPFQSRQHVSIATRPDGTIIAAGAEGNQVSIWKLDGTSAELELCVKTSCNIDAVAISTDGSSVAYSSSTTRIVRYDGSSWALDEEVRQHSSCLCFNSEGTLFSCDIDGSLTNGITTINLGFPIFHIAVSSNSHCIVVGGLKKMKSLSGDLKAQIEDLPNFGSPFSTFEFQPGKNRLFITTGQTKNVVYNVRKKQVVPKLSINLGKIREVVAINKISFDPDLPNRVVFMSSQVAIVINLLAKEKGKYRLPYDDFLFAQFVQGKKIVVFEKPWTFMMESLPKPFRVKRFQGADDTKRPRY